jgi:hypothetical protein
MSVSPWTTLPAELREQIYAYVLTEPSGLSYHTGTDGVNRICAREKQAVCVKTRSGRLPALFHFIYNSVSAVSQGAAIAAEELGFNQIQYVSRQCYGEAHGLEFLYNNVLFEDSCDMSAGQRCRVFVNRVVKKDYVQYLSLSIRGAGFSFQPPGYSGSPITLAEFCTQHPKASLRLHHPFWCQRRPGFFLLGIAYTAAVREYRVLDYLIWDQVPWLDFDLTGIKSTLPKEGVPLNFRLVPFEERIDRDTLRESFREYPFFQGKNSSVWLDVAENWFVEGL